jgi:hypothetical protein
MIVGFIKIRGQGNFLPDAESLPHRLRDGNCRSFFCLLKTPFGVPPKDTAAFA